MIELIKLDMKPSENSKARLIGYLHDRVENEMPTRLTRPCVLICPGGGYEFLSERESDPPAFAFFARGYNVFILYYSVKEQAAQMRPLVEISDSVRLIRRNSAEWGINADQIAVCGFSAGAHLAASLGTLWNHPALKEKTDTGNGANRPDAMILCYPVISSGPYAHRGSICQITGGKDDPELLELFSLEKQVSSQTPPAFLWHTVEDGTVPVENTMLFISALQKHKVPFECHIYPNGGHGLSMCSDEVNTPNPHCASWFRLCETWLNDLFHFTY
ncbi:alpha/beta hydrolase [Caproiciproducens sp. LBM24188]|nr:alpha/beta hydrolase [Oscillospiraceae bacterium]